MVMFVTKNIAIYKGETINTTQHNPVGDVFGEELHHQYDMHFLKADGM